MKHILVGSLHLDNCCKIAGYIKLISFYYKLDMFFLVKVCTDFISSVNRVIRC